MAETTFTLRVDEDLKQRFTLAAEAQDRSSSQVLREFMRRFAAQADQTPAYDQWFASKVRAAQADPRPAVPGVVAEAYFAHLRAAARERAAGKRKRGTRRR